MHAGTERNQIDWTRPREHTRIIYMIIIIYNIIRAVYPEHICVVVHALCGTNAVLFFQICVCFEWMTTIWPCVYVKNEGEKRRGKDTWGFGRCVVKRFLRRRWTERHLQREIERLSDLALYNIYYYTRKTSKTRMSQTRNKKIKKDYSNFGQSTASILYYVIIEVVI